MTLSCLVEQKSDADSKSSPKTKVEESDGRVDKYDAENQIEVRLDLQTT